MSTQRLLLILLVLGTTTCAPVACKAGTASADTTAQILEGIRLHDVGRYDDAIAVYRQVLEIDSSNFRALYEIAHSTLAKGDPAGAIPWVERALSLGPPNKNEFYQLLGVAREATGDLVRAEDAFRQAIAARPDRAPLHFSLGITLMKQGRFDAAMKAFEDNLVLRPNHTSGWLALAEMLERKGSHARMFAAHVRFLTLETDPDRSRRSAALLWPLLFQWTQLQEGRVQMRVPPPEPKPSAQYTENLFMALVAAARYKQDWASKSDAAYFAYALDQLLGFLSENHVKAGGDALWGPYVFAYFDGAREAGHIEALAYVVRRSTGDGDIIRWLRENTGAVDRYQAWSAQWSSRLQTPPQDTGVWTTPRKPSGETLR